MGGGEESRSMQLHKSVLHLSYRWDSYELSMFERARTKCKTMGEIMRNFMMNHIPIGSRLKSLAEHKEILVGGWVRVVKSTYYTSEDPGLVFSSHVNYV